jgi:hypothetical protein
MSGERSRLVVTDEDRQSKEYQAARYACELGNAPGVELARRSGLTQSRLESGPRAV